MRALRHTPAGRSRGRGGVPGLFPGRAERGWVGGVDASGAAAGQAAAGPTITPAAAGGLSGSRRRSPWPRLGPRAGSVCGRAAPGRGRAEGELRGALGVPPGEQRLLLVAR